MSSANSLFNNDRGNSSRGAKGEATVFEDAGRLKINLPRQYFGGKQVKKALGLQANAENWSRAERIAKRITLDLQDGCFDETLVKYGVKSNIKLLSSSDNLPPKPKLSTLDIWEKYLEYKKPNIKETCFKAEFCTKYSIAIKQAIETVGDDPIAIRSWLLSNRCLRIAKIVLSHLSYSYRLLIKQGLIYHDPFQGMAEDLPKIGRNQKVNIYEQEDEANSLYDAHEVKKKAFTTNEVEFILESVKKTKASYYYPFLHFLFLTGTRTNEATGFMWGDVKWEKEYIVIQRSYSLSLKKFVSTKTGHIRLFPMPKNGELWGLLKSMQQGALNELVFKSKTGKPINSGELSRFWRGSINKAKGCPGLIPTLISQGKVSKYLPLYNTRHTFISYQINECGIPPHVVKDWCGHSEKMTTETYRQENLLIKPVDYNNESSPKQPSEPSRIEVLEQQVELLIQQNKMLQEIIVNLETKSKASNVEPIA